jgi:Tfp pilus assembly protein FimT
MRSAASGYSLCELLVVLAIVDSLAFAGVTMNGNRQSGAVRSGAQFSQGGRAVIQAREVWISTPVQSGN